MKNKKLKHRCNFVCRITGWHDRLFRLVALNSDGIATSSFIEGRRALFVSEASQAVDTAQRTVIAARTKSDEIMAQLSEDDIKLITKGSKDVYEERKRKKVLHLFEELVAIRNEIKATYVKLHSDLDDAQAEIKRELTAYLLAAFSRKRPVDITRNATLDYKDKISYQAYLSSYEYADKAVNDVVDSIIRSEALSNYIKEAA